MNISRLKKICLKSVIGFLSLSAVVAIVSLLAGSFGDVQIKVILTTLTISGASVCAMACAAFIEKRGLAAVGLTGIGFSLLAASLGIFGMWHERTSDDFWKVTVTLVIGAAGFAHGCLLFIPTLARKFVWSQVGVVMAVGTLAFMVDAAVWGEINESSYYRLIGVVSVVVVFLTLLVPIFAKLGAAREEESGVLKLRMREGDVYVGEDGALYRVVRI